MVTDDYFHQSNLIEGFDSEEADACLRRAWEYLSKFDNLTRGVICKTQKLATLHQTDLRPDWRGYYRDVDVWIGGHKGMAPAKIPMAMNNLLSTQGFTHTRAWHVQFETIHPFADGNGRTGRLIMWWMELQRGQKPTLITYAGRQDYYRWFNG